jgi:hypothetical protein
MINITATTQHTNRRHETEPARKSATGGPEDDEITVADEINCLCWIHRRIMTTRRITTNDENRRRRNVQQSMTALRSLRPRENLQQDGINLQQSHSPGWIHHCCQTHGVMQRRSQLSFRRHSRAYEATDHRTLHRRAAPRNSLSDVLH